MAEERPSARDRILEAAIRVFSRKGFHGANLRELTAEADVNISMVSYYFKSKQGVWLALFEQFFDNVSARAMTALKREGSPEERLRWLITALATGFAENPDLTRIVLSEAPTQLHSLRERILDRHRGIFPALETFLQEWECERSPSIRMEALIPAMFGLAAWHFVGRPLYEQVFDSRFDAAFYRRYPEEIANLFMFGVLGNRSVSDNDGASEPC